MFQLCNQFLEFVISEARRLSLFISWVGGEQGQGWRPSSRRLSSPLNKRASFLNCSSSECPSKPPIRRSVRPACVTFPPFFNRQIISCHHHSFYYLKACFKAQDALSLLTDFQVPVVGLIKASAEEFSNREISWDPLAIALSKSGFNLKRHQLRNSRNRGDTTTALLQGAIQVV